MRVGWVVAVVLGFAYAAVVRPPPAAPAFVPSLAEDQPTGAFDPSEPSTAPPASIAELRAALGRVLAREGIAGATIALVDRTGPIYVGGLGVRDRATGAPMEPDTAFRVGSLSKSVIALGVMRLVDQGKLDVDRPLRDYLPGAVDNPWEATAPVTLAQCLEHTAGLDDVRFNEVFTDDEHLSVAATLALNPRSRRVRWPPGTRHAYSNVGYTLAARAIEVASGEPFDVYVRREILAPMGIVDADFARSGTLGARLATGYLERDGAPLAYHPFAHRPAGALLASAADLARLVHFWLVRGAGYPPIVSARGLERIERSGTLPYAHVDSEYGFASYADVTHPVLSRGHDGGSPGFHATVRYVPSLGVGYVLLLNSAYTFRGYFELRALLYGYLARGRTAAPPPADLGARAAAPPDAAFYAFASPRNEFFGFLDRAREGMHVDLADAGRVRIADRRASATLIPTADGAYRFPRDCGSSVRFTTSPDGTPLLVTGFAYYEAASGFVADVRFVALGLVAVLLYTAPLWAIGAIVRALYRRRRVRWLVAWPALAGLCALAWPHLLLAGFMAGSIGKVCAITVALCAVSIAFPLACAATLVATVRACLRPDGPPRAALVLPMIYGLAFCALAAWLGAHGWLGLRTWAY